MGFGSQPAPNSVGAKPSRPFRLGQIETPAQDAVLLERMVREPALDFSRPNPRESQRGRQLISVTRKRSSSVTVD